MRNAPNNRLQIQLHYRYDENATGKDEKQRAEH